jgi:hypothetical protein
MSKELDFLKQDIEGDGLRVCILFDSLGVD